MRSPFTGLIAKAYSAKTGKPVEDYRALMDEESWYFGEEMIEAGFVDEIIKTDTPKDRASAIAQARADIETLHQKMPSFQNSEIEQIAQRVL